MEDTLINPAGKLIIIILFVLWLAIPAVLAIQKGRNWITWVTLSFFLPLISLFVLILLPSVKDAKPPSNAQNPKSKKDGAEKAESSKTKKTYSEEFKKEVVAATLSPGETITSVAKLYDVNATLVRNWKDKYEEEVLSEMESAHRTALNSEDNVSHKMVDENPASNDGASMNDNSDHHDDTVVTPTLIWHIDRAKFIFSDPSEYKQWKKEKKVFFEFSPTGADDGGETVFVDPESAEADFEVTEGRGTIKVKLEKDGPVITAWVGVDAETVDGLDEETLSEWANDQGGWASCSIHLGDFDASIEEDDGGDWRLPGNEDN